MNANQLELSDMLQFLIPIVIIIIILIIRQWHERSINRRVDNLIDKVVELNGENVRLTTENEMLKEYEKQVVVMQNELNTIKIELENLHKDYIELKNVELASKAKTTE